MAYDADNQLELVYADSNGDEEYDQATENPVAAYAYDALGRRIMFRNHYDGSGIYGSDPTKVTTRYVYDGQNVIEEFNTNGTRQRYYVHGTSYIDERAVLHDDVDTDEDYYYLLKDLYTVVGLLNKQGHDVERYIYDAYGRVTMVSNPLFDVNFDGVSSIADGKIIHGKIGKNPCSAGPIHDMNGDGDIDLMDAAHPPISPWWDENEVIPASGLGNSYHFTGRRLDAYLDAPVGTNGVKQIQYNRARYYDLDNGRWLQRDPSGYSDGMNLYEYVRSHPTLGLDPIGLVTITHIKGTGHSGQGELYFKTGNCALASQLRINGRVIMQMGELKAKTKYQLPLDQNRLVDDALTLTPLPGVPGRRLPWTGTGMGDGSIKIETMGDGSDSASYVVYKKSKRINNNIGGALFNTKEKAGSAAQQVGMNTAGWVQWTEVGYSVAQSGMTRLFMAGPIPRVADKVNLALDYSRLPLVMRDSITGGPSIKGGPSWSPLVNDAIARPARTLAFSYIPSRRYWFDDVKLKVKWNLTIGGTPLVPVGLAGALSGGTAYSIRIP